MPAEAAIAAPPLLPVPRRSREESVRRGWGAYFALWSAALFALLLTGGVALAWGVGPGSRGEVLVALVDLVWVFGAGLLTLRHFRGVWQRTHFPIGRVARGFLVSFLLLLAAVVAEVAGGDPTGDVVASLLLLPVAGVLVYQLRWTAPRVPVEAWGAVVSLALTGVVSAVVAGSTRDPWAYGASWMITVVAWAVAGGYAYVAVPPDPSSGTARGTW